MTVIGTWFCSIDVFVQQRIAVSAGRSRDGDTLEGHDPGVYQMLELNDNIKRIRISGQQKGMVMCVCIGRSSAAVSNLKRRQDQLWI